ncbi:MAG TPA: NYN domain-containing protein [Streptosporangiaceae bacterium]
MDRCALFVDAGYLLADGALAVHGTRHRETVSWDFGGLLQLLGNLARERTGLPLLRCYWYEATVEGRRSPEHEALADLPGLKLRLGRIRPGRREGVDTEIHRDLMTLARNGALADAIVVSNDEDLAQVITDAQDLGVRVTVVHVAVDGNWTISRALRQECDDLIEIGSGHLRPYVNLLTGVDTSSSPLSNGHAASTGGTIAPLQTGPHTSPPPGSPITSPVSSVSPVPSVSGPAASAAQSQGGQTSQVTQVGHVPQQSQPSQLDQPASPLYAAPTPTANSPAPMSGSQYVSPPQQHGPYTGPQQLTPAPAAQQPTSTLSDAVKAAHQEGQDFGESVARDAPALWLEAVLARKPRMPSDLEARLLQGSSLPIDFLLHDEVRHALRRGFWDALERSRR